MIAENLDRIRARVAQACVRSKRDPRDITLIAVAKTFPSSAVAEAVAAGVSDIGENYVQELREKKEVLSHLPIRWHFIGHLQRNKVRAVVPWVQLIHAVDSEELAAEINVRAHAAGKAVEVLLEVNTTGEQSKFGISPRDTIPLIRRIAHLEWVRLAGLMTIGPFLPDPEGSRPMFRTLRELRQEAAGIGQPNAPMQFLSMGMTGDFEVAVEEGATHLRIGTALFGKRAKRG